MRLIAITSWGRSVFSNVQAFRCRRNLPPSASHPRQWRVASTFSDTDRIFFLHGRILHLLLLLFLSYYRRRQKLYGVRSWLVLLLILVLLAVLVVNSYFSGESKVIKDQEFGQMGSRLHGSERGKCEGASSRNYSKSTRSLGYSSHLSRRCRTSRSNHASSRTLDFNIDRKLDNSDIQNNCGYSSMAENDGLVEHKALRSIGHRLHRKLSSSNTNKSAGKFSTAPPNRQKPKFQECSREITSSMGEHVDGNVKQDISVADDSHVCAHKHSCDVSCTGDESLESSSVRKEESKCKILKIFCDDGSLTEGGQFLEGIPRHASDGSTEPAQNECLGFESSDELIHVIKSVGSDNRKLASEIVEELQRWVMKREYMQNETKTERLGQDALMNNIEEKKDIQLFMERELNTKFSDWSSNCEKITVEANRIQEHLKFLVEKNTSLQREVGFLRSKQTENQASLEKNETQLTDLLRKLEEAESEKTSFCQDLTDIGERCKEVEAERDSARIRYKEKEKENKDLQRLVIILQRTCNAQEKMICGLRLEADLDNGIVDKTDHTCKLQPGQMRVTSIEQTLRNELELLRFEVESHRQENTYLLERLQISENVSGVSSLKLDQELHARIRSLQDQGLSLLDQSSKVCDELLDLIKSQLHEKSLVKGEHFEEHAYDLMDYYFFETDIKIKTLKEELDNFKRSVEITAGCLHERLNLLPFGCQYQTQHTGENEPQPGIKLRRSQVNADYEREAEVLLGRILRERLCSKEIEFDYLQAEFTSFIRLHYILKADIHRLHDSLYYLTNRIADLELEVAKRNATISSLEIILQKYRKDLIILKKFLTQVSGERDLMREQVLYSNEKSTFHKSELVCLHKRIEALEEEILIKEGEITILQDCYNEASLRVR